MGTSSKPSLRASSVASDSPAWPHCQDEFWKHSVTHTLTLPVPTAIACDHKPPKDQMMKEVRAPLHPPDPPLFVMSPHGQRRSPPVPLPHIYLLKIEQISRQSDHCFSVMLMPYLLLNPAWIQELQVYF